MTVVELIEELSKYPDNLKIYVSHCSDNIEVGREGNEVWIL